MNSSYKRIPAKLRHARGFTLTEILVTISIIVLLAVLSVFGIRSLREKAWAANASSFLRQNGTAIQGYLSDKGRYPEAWDFGGGSGGGAWSWQIRDYLGYHDGSSWPVETVLHPRHGRKGIDALNDNARQNIHHFAASAIVLQDVDETDTKSTKTYIREGQVSNPSSTITLGDAPLKNPLQPSSGCHAAWWSLRFAAIKGSPNDPVDQAALEKSVEFWFNGKAHFLFVDGHVEALSPQEVKKKHFQL
ncbi:MAG: type II secretion system GspH family protein [Akkermansiaceae bacterium]|jgi:prepilin-type N-terminal cleavage/methylation domain-containing protein/prepilin-type processing-associated H-X9-DG protein|nr:type II secretion system GspH family protein [Akkermansiaceae bacterium]